MTEREKHQAQFQAGLRNITEAVVTGLAAIGIKLTAKNVDWRGWRPGQPIPNTALQITFKPDGLPAMEFPFTREQIADSWESLESAEVRNLVRRIVKNYRDVQSTARNA